MAEYSEEVLYEQLIISIDAKYGHQAEPVEHGHLKLLSDLEVNLPIPHPKQVPFVDSEIKRKIVRAGRRGGKTVGAAILSVKKFRQARRILYATPTAEQIGRFWVTVTRALAIPIEKKLLYKNETSHIIEVPGTDIRIKAKTAWNADTLRGDYADVLILDEWQLMDESAWEYVGSPMLLDNNGDAVFIYTPPSLHSRSASKAKDPQHAAKMYKKAEQDTMGRWAFYHFTSHDNPHISKEALSDITRDMTNLAYRMEILAIDESEAAGALWNRKIIEDGRTIKIPELTRIVVGVDPSVTSMGDEAGIVTAGVNGENGYVLADDSVQGSPLTWASAAVKAYYLYSADKIIAEANNGGEMVELTIAQVDPTVPVELVHATRGKRTRAEPIVAQYEKKKVHHVGTFPALEDELCLWVPGDESPNRLDACVWALTELMLGGSPGFFIAGRGNA
jgi:hypothetical protein